MLTHSEQEYYRERHCPVDCHRVPEVVGCKHQGEEVKEEVL